MYHGNEKRERRANRKRFFLDANEFVRIKEVVKASIEFCADAPAMRPPLPNQNRTEISNADVIMHTINANFFDETDNSGVPSEIRPYVKYAVITSKAARSS